MSELLSTVSGFMSGAGGKGLNSLLSLAGTGTNIFSGIQNMQQNQRLANAQKYVTDLVTNPAKMTQATAAYTAPLTAGLTDEITNQVQGNLSERGLGSSPAAFTQQLTQALAPFVQNNQNQGFQNLMASLGLASGGNLHPFPNMDITQLLKQLQLGKSSPDSSPGGGSLDSILSEIENPTNLQTSYDTQSFLFPEEEPADEYAYAAPMD